MIPKKIHYIWLGKNEKSSLTNICIRSWKEKLPDYEIIEWNEENLDLEKIASENKFFAECKKRNMWAFMADYLRLKILYENGGIYFDTDVQVLKKFDDLLAQEYIIGMEDEKDVSSAVIGCEKNNWLIGKMLEFYNERIWNESIYIITNVMTRVIQEQKENIKIYAKEYFSPISYQEKYKDACVTNNTYAIHWFNASWNQGIYVYNFLEIKHIKNPVLKNFLKAKKTIGFKKRQFISKLKRKK